MAKANPKLKSSLYGRWHIVSMSGQSLNEEGQAFIEFRADGYGEFHVGYVQGEFDYRTKHRKGIRMAQFNWAGNETEGFGWAMVQGDEMTGTICVHLGDKSEFVAKLAAETTQVIENDEDDQDELKLGKGAAFVKSRLKHLPQENDTWEADFEMLPKTMTMQTVGQYVGMVVTQPEGFLLALEEVEHMPNVDDLATLLAHAMNRPLIEGAHRPRQIVVRKNPRWQPLFRHLQEIGVKVAVQDDLPKIAEEYGDYLRQINKVQPSEQQAAVEKAFPAIAKWVQGYGHIEIGEQEGLGFVVAAFDDSGLVFEDNKAETVAEAMAALEQGLEEWFKDGAKKW